MTFGADDEDAELVAEADDLKSLVQMWETYSSVPEADR